MKVTISIKGHERIGKVDYERRLLDWAQSEELTAEEVENIVACVEYTVNRKMYALRSGKRDDLKRTGS
jgi:hypothetical protein